MVDLKTGDMLYFSPHLALGLLLGHDTTHDGQVVWRYLLRSPTRENLDCHLLSIHRVHEFKIIDGIKSGRLEYYKVGTRKCQQ